MIVFLVIRYFVYAVAASSLTMVWQVSFINKYILVTFGLIVIVIVISLTIVCQVTFTLSLSLLSTSST